MERNNISPDASNETKELRRKIRSLQAQLDIERSRNARLAGGYLLNSEEIDYYPGEQLDFLISILKQVQMRCPADSRSYDIITSLLAVNQPIGYGEEILCELERIFKRGEPTSTEDISALRAIGFSYTQSRKHPKLRFHDKYMFVVPATSSDRRRSGHNSLAEIGKCIAVKQKV